LAIKVEAIADGDDDDVSDVSSVHTSDLSLSDDDGNHAAFVCCFEFLPQVVFINSFSFSDVKRRPVEKKRQKKRRRQAGRPNQLRFAKR
jgi:hypothetical protein